MSVLAPAVLAFSSSPGEGWPSPARVGGSLATDKPPNPKACFRWGTTAELRCMDHLSPFWSGWGFCAQLLTNRTVVDLCDADSIEYPCTYAGLKMMTAGQCLLEACKFEVDHTDYDCLDDCPKHPASMYYSPLFQAQCTTFQDPAHPCGKRCFQTSRTTYELFKVVCGTCPKNDAKDCAFCAPEDATDGEGEVGNCYPLTWCPTWSEEGGGPGSIFSQLGTPDWEEIFPDEAESKLVCTDQKVCEPPSGAAEICSVDDIGNIVNCNAHQG